MSNHMPANRLDLIEFIEDLLDLVLPDVRDAGIDPAFYANRTFGEDEVLPWDVIDCGVTKAFLLRERHRAYAGNTTPNCREQCSGCGASCLGGERTCCPKAKV